MSHYLGCMTYKGVGRFHFIEKSMESNQYIQVLNHELMNTVRDQFPSQEWIFQQDSASCHTSKKVKTEMTKLNIQVLPWAGNSPDANPLKTFDGKLERRLQIIITKVKMS